MKKQTFRKRFGITLGVGLFLLSGCSAGTASTEATSKNSSSSIAVSEQITRDTWDPEYGGLTSTEVNPEDSSWAEIEEAGKIRVGITGGFAPSNYHEDVDGELIGYEADAIRAIVDELGVEVEFVEMPFKSLTASLDADRIDIIMHSMGITEERTQKFNFTIPYFRSTYAVLVHDDSNLETLGDLEGTRAAQSVNTSTGVVAESLGASLVPIDTVAEAVDLVVRERADFYIADKTGTLYFLEQQPDLPVHLLEEEMKVPHEIGGVVPKGEDTLTVKLNDAIYKLTKDGTLGEIYQDYLGRDISVEEYR